VTPISSRMTCSCGASKLNGHPVYVRSPFQFWHSL
jgi:hypothetical protein